MRILLTLAALLLAACGGDPPARLNIGDRAPAFQAVGLDGKPVDYPAAWAGRPLAIRFWADWCRYCEGEMKGIETAYRRLRARGLEVVAINAGQDRSTVQAFVGRIGISYPALLDESSVVARRYGVAGLPTTYFVDAQGIVRAKLIGEADAATFERHALALLP